jgi:hypothetical protein
MIYIAKFHIWFNWVSTSFVPSFWFIQGIHPTGVNGGLPLTIIPTVLFRLFLALGASLIRGPVGIMVFD